MYMETEGETRSTHARLPYARAPLERLGMPHQLLSGQRIPIVVETAERLVRGTKYLHPALAVNQGTSGLPDTFYLCTESSSVLRHKRYVGCGPH